MIKYTVNVFFDVVSNVKVAHIEIPELNLKWTEYAVTPFKTRTYKQSDLPGILKWELSKIIMQRKLIGLPKNEDGNVALDWQTEVRIRLSNYFIEKYKDDKGDPRGIDAIAEEYGERYDSDICDGSLSDEDIDFIFDPMQELNIVHLFKLADAFRIEMKINLLALELS